MNDMRPINFHYEVRIPDCTTFDTFFEIYEWCEQQFGNAYPGRHGRWMSETAETDDPDFNLWFFLREADATLFQLTWG